MSEIKLCISCKERPIVIKKRGLCLLCYQRERKQTGGFIDQKTHKYCRSTYKATQPHNREIEFIKNFFTHNNWIYQPALFRFDGQKYSPDFYDAERNVFIEVSGSRQAYHESKNKYKDFRKYYPKIIFEIRKSNGELLDEKGHWKEWQEHPTA